MTKETKLYKNMSFTPCLHLVDQNGSILGFFRHILLLVFSVYSAFLQVVVLCKNVRRPELLLLRGNISSLYVCIKSRTFLSFYTVCY